MSDGTYGLIMALTCLAYIGVLWVRWLRGRSLRRLQQLLEKDPPRLTPSDGSANSGEPQ